MVICRFCKKPLLRSETLVPDRIVRGCRPCGQWYVEGVGELVQSGYNLGGRLLATVPVPEKRTAAYDAAKIDWSSPDWK